MSVIEQTDCLRGMREAQMLQETAQSVLPQWLRPPREELAAPHWMGTCTHLEVLIAVRGASEGDLVSALRLVRMDSYREYL